MFFQRIKHGALPFLVMADQFPEIWRFHIDEAS